MSSKGMFSNPCNDKFQSLSPFKIDLKPLIWKKLKLRRKCLKKHRILNMKKDFTNKTCIDSSQAMYILIIQREIP